MNTYDKPHYEGPGGRAWKLDWEAIRRKHNVTAENDSGVGCWVIHAPASHPIWPWYRLPIIDLRPRACFPPPIIHLPGATHEFHLDALNPDYYPPDINDIPHHTLRPTNFAAQLICESDEAAVKRIEDQAIKPICEGTLSPDTDWLQWWMKLFGDHMVKPEFRATAGDTKIVMSTPHGQAEIVVQGPRPPTAKPN